MGFALRDRVRFGKNLVTTLVICSSWSAMAQSGLDTLALEGSSRLAARGEMHWGMSVAMAVIVGFLLWAILSRIVQELTQGAVAAEHLYMRMLLRVGEAERGRAVHVVRLSLDEASMVVDFPINKGASCALDLGSLPGFPDHACQAEARVVALRPLAGDPKSLEVRVRFGKNLNQEATRALREYLHALRGQRLSHA